MSKMADGEWCARIGATTERTVSAMIAPQIFRLIGFLLGNLRGSLPRGNGFRTIRPGADERVLPGARRQVWWQHDRAACAAEIRSGEGRARRCPQSRRPL